MIQAPFALAGHNPDVLTCIANLSNDEVFTPPELANQMLDTLEQSWASGNNGENLWANKEVTFLDPCTKSGVFLREIVKRLNVGLTAEIPDLTERVNHILTKQVFGIGITQLTSLLARRSLYCSKNAKGKYSIAREFETNEGNIWFERTEHTWVNGKCKFCGASKGEYSRTSELETHAYVFIHSENIKKQLSEMFGAKMQFDVIIGNPPYQLSDGGAAASARPIYHLFIEQAKKLEPRFLCMVVPARWYSGGKGLDDFRASMLRDDRVRRLFDFPSSNDVFPGTQIKGGVCYFVWDRENKGPAEITSYDRGEVVSNATRQLLEPGLDVFIRYNDGLVILRKVMKFEASETYQQKNLTLPVSKRFSSLISSRKPFGFTTDFRGKEKSSKSNVKIYQNGGVAFVERKDVIAGRELIDCWKVFVSAAYGAGDTYPHSIIGAPLLGSLGSVSTETYLCVGPFVTEDEAQNVRQYMATRFVRFLILLRKPTQHATKEVYSFVPVQDFSQRWTDEKLYKKYGVTEEEIAFIEKMVRPMELDGD